MWILVYFYGIIPNFYCGDLDTIMYMMYYEVGDTNDVLDTFIPMWYNETKGCLVGRIQQA